MNLSGKIALVTGASRGIGKSIALELSKAGAVVIVNYRKDEKGAMDTLKLIKESGNYGECIKADVRYYNDVYSMTYKIIKKYGNIDILVNNAGVSKTGLFIDMTEDEWNELLDINLKGVINCCHCVLNHMVSKKSGNIINISSIWGNTGASCEAIYSATKGAINGFTKALAKELAPSNIRVNAIAPGVIDTQMNNNLSKEEKEALKLEIPMMRFGNGEDIAKLAVFLSSENSKYITGQIITVDGGMI